MAKACVHVIVGRPKRAGTNCAHAQTMIAGITQMIRAIMIIAAKTLPIYVLQKVKRWCVLVMADTPELPI